MKLALISINQTALDFAGNQARLVHAIREARDQGADLAVCGELSITGYGCEDAFLFAAVPRQAWGVLQELISQVPPDVSFIVGLPVNFQDRIFNCAAFVARGRLIALRAKTVLADAGLYYEPRWFTAWPTGQVDALSTAEATIPIGDLSLAFDDIHIGFEICEEAWGPAPHLKQAAFDLVLNVSASHFAVGKQAIRKSLVLARAKQLQTTYCYVNLIGLDAGRAIYDGGCMAAGPRGWLAMEKRFHWAEHQVTWLDLPATAPAGTAGGDHATGRIPVPILLVPGTAGLPGPGGSGPGFGNEISRDLPPEEEFLQAEILALWDYLRKSGAKGYSISLSGGCDSSVCAALVSFMVDHAIAIFGLASLNRVLRSDWQSAPNAKAGLLQCFYLASRFSSQETETAAAAIAAETGASFASLSIQGMVDDYVTAGEQATGESLNWQDHGLSLQNIQARARAPLAWLLANVKGHILLTTANRSEAATGYFTMDGDSAGGLAPLAGVSKDFLRRWLRWAGSGRHLPPGFTPLPALTAVARLEPSAELSSSAQRDEDELMPYDVLACIEEAFLNDRLSIGDILDSLPARLASNHSREQLDAWVKLFAGKWRANQWKRGRLAHAFHIMPASCDPQGFFRFPILSGGIPGQ